MERGEKIMEMLDLINIKARGQGQGVGGAKQEDGGADYCVCSKCGYKVKHKKGVICNEKKCPKCGTKLVGK